MSVLVFDIETAAIANAADYLDPATPPGNYKDPLVIANWIEKANAEAVAKAALDVDLARIVCIGIHHGGSGDALVDVAHNEDEERVMLTAFWQITSEREKGSVDRRPTLIGYNCIAFDLPVLLRRSLYLGVKAPKLQIGKYRHDGIEDLMLALSFDGALRFRSLNFYARRFGLDVPKNEHAGADIAGLVAAGDYDAVATHCRSDVATTVALARRMGVI